VTGGWIKLCDEEVNNLCCSATDQIKEGGENEKSVESFGW
jgi:hypothetical protein